MENESVVLDEQSVVIEDEIQEAKQETFLDDESVMVEDEPELIVEEPELTVEPDKFVIKIDGVWFKSWNPFQTCKRKYDALILDEDWARHYKSVIPMTFRLPVEVVKI